MIVVNSWGRLFAYHSIFFFTDNKALESVINEQKSKDPVVVEMVIYLSKHTPGKHKKMADSISVLQVQEFQKPAPHAHRGPSDVLEALMPQNVWNTLTNLLTQSYLHPLRLHIIEHGRPKSFAIDIKWLVIYL